MAIFKYNINEMGDKERADVIEELKAVLNDSEVADISDDGSCLTITTLGDDLSVDEGEIKKILASHTPIQSKTEEKYVYVGKTPKKISLISAVCAAIICSVVCILATFAICKLTETSYDNGNGDEGTTNAPGENIQPPANDLTVPHYFSDLIKLDEIFKENSFDGINEEEMKEAILDAYIAATGDLYAEYLNAEEYADYFSDQSGEFVGIGVSIINSEITVSGFDYKVMEIISVFKDSPALEYGVQVGDCIMYVDNEGEQTLVNVLGYTKALDVMLGEAGTLANFTVFRPDGDDYKEIEFSIPRRKVVTESVTYRVSETDPTVGIINITGFDLTTPPQFKKAVNALKDTHGCEYIVFDMRNNPGGSLDSIETVLSYFLERGDEIVSTEYANGKKETSYVREKQYIPTYSAYDVKSEEIGMYKDLNCIVITNGNTASAAELFTATMRDYGIAEIVGTKTYGKGCMQAIIPLESEGIEGGLKLTVAMYYSQSKTVYHGTGIKPDHVIDLSEEAKKINFFILPENKDAQLLKAIEILTK